MLRQGPFAAAASQPLLRHCPVGAAGCDGSVGRCRGRIAYKGTGKKKGKRYMGKPENDTTGHGHGTEAVDPTAPAQGDITLSGKSGLPVEFMKQHYGGGANA